MFREHAEKKGGDKLKTRRQLRVLAILLTVGLAVISGGNVLAIPLVGDAIVAELNVQVYSYGDTGTGVPTLNPNEWAYVYQITNDVTGVDIHWFQLGGIAFNSAGIIDITGGVGPAKKGIVAADTVRWDWEPGPVLAPGGVSDLMYITSNFSPDSNPLFPNVIATVHNSADVVDAFVTGPAVWGRSTDNTTVPEPSTLLTLGMGLLFGAGVKYYSRKPKRG